MGFGISEAPGNTTAAVPGSVAMTGQRSRSNKKHRDDGDQEEEDKEHDNENSDNFLDDPDINPFHEDSAANKGMKELSENLPNVSEDVEPFGDQERGGLLSNRSAAEAAMYSAGPTFEDLDSTVAARDGVITQDEAATWGMKNGVPWSEMKGLFVRFDRNNNSKLEKREFEAALPNSQNFLSSLGSSFEDIDYNGDKLISEPEWLAFCNGWMTPKPSEAVCKEIFKEADVDAPHDLIDKVEFAGTEDEENEDGRAGRVRHEPATKDDMGSMLRGSSEQGKQPARVTHHEVASAPSGDSGTPTGDQAIRSIGEGGRDVIYSIGDAIGLLQPRGPGAGACVGECRHVSALIAAASKVWPGFGRRKVSGS